MSIPLNQDEKERVGRIPVSVLPCHEQVSGQPYRLDHGHYRDYEEESVLSRGEQHRREGRAARKPYRADAVGGTCRCGAHPDSVADDRKQRRPCCGREDVEEELDDQRDRQRDQQDDDPLVGCPRVDVFRELMKPWSDSA
jgi:hypothetical protein